MEREREFEALIERWLPEYGLTPAPATRLQLARYLAMVEDWNQRLRLVGDRSPEVLVKRHLGESLYLGQVLELRQQRLVDVGSGAGFPGLALALAWPELTTTLVESTHKKASFLEAAVQELGMASRVGVISAYLERRPRPGAEEPLAAALAQAEVVTVRALERMQQTPQWLGRWLGERAVAAFWVSAPMAETWRGVKGWRWSELHRLPGSEQRGIVLGWVAARHGDSGA